MDRDGTVADAVAWRDGRVLAVGSRQQVMARVRDAGYAPRVTDLGGATVLPGFIDAHHHVAIGILYGGIARLGPPKVQDIPTLQRALAEASQRLEPGRWLLASRWDENLLRERRPPSRTELDEAVPDRPLFALHYTCHQGVANSRALELASIDRHTPDPPGGWIRRGRGGVPTGLLIERGMSRVEALARSNWLAGDREGYLRRLADHYRQLAAVGITGVVDCAVPTDLMPFFHELAARGDLTVPTVLCPTSMEGWLEQPLDVLDGPPTGQSDGPITVGPVKLVFDGSPSCAMCMSWFQSLVAITRTLGLVMRSASLDPWRTAMSVSPRFGRKVRSGIALYAPDEARSVITAITERGFGVATHAVGNAGVDTALGAYEAVGAEALRRCGIAPRLEHALFVDHQLVKRIADCGANVSVQPAMLAHPRYAHAVPIPQLPFFPLRWLLDAGVRLAGSSDFPVEGFDPLDGVRAAVNRRTARGSVREADQRIELDEALALYTREAAEVCGWRDRGTLQPGKRADIVVLDRALTKASLDEARVKATISAGSFTYETVG